MRTRLWSGAFWIALLVALAWLLWSIYQPAPPPVPATSTPTIAVLIVNDPTRPVVPSMTPSPVPTERLPMVTATRAPTETLRATETPTPAVLDTSHDATATPTKVAVQRG
jgi:hypothetical protein